MKNNKKWPVLKFVTRLILVISGFFILSSAYSYQAQGLDWLFPSNDELSDEDINKIRDVYNSIQNYYIEDVSKEQLLEGALKGMVDSLEDPYSEYLNAQESVDMDDSLEGSFQGVGIQFISREGQITVVSPIEGTPASEAGIQPNDIILEADGVELTGMDTNEVVQLIRGEEGTSVTLTIQRGASTFEVDLIRAEIPIITVTAELDKNQPTIGNILVNQFNSTTYEEIVEAIEDLRNQGAEAFVFDFRYNPGGLLDEALQISNIFLEEGEVIMQIQEANSDAISEYADNRRLGDFKVTEPYVLLINEGSASASEILAATIKENTDAPIIGQTSFGKGSVQTITNQTEMGELKLTIAKWLTPSGDWIHDIGVEPTQIVESHPVNGAILLSSEETLAIGEASDVIESLTLMLDALGYDVNISSFFDESVEEAVKAFQEDNDLEVTGKVTGDTAYELNEQARTFIEENDLQYEEAIKLLEEVLAVDEAA